MSIRCHYSERKRGFTLIELLAVIGLMMVLAAILIPAVGLARKTMERTKCASNLKQLGVSFALYAVDHDGVLPSGISFSKLFWDHYVDDYIPGGRERGIFACPTEKKQPTSGRSNYIGNTRVLVDTQDNKSAPVPLSRISRPAEVTLIMDGAVNDSGNTNFGFYEQPEVTSYSSDKYADRSIPQGPDGTTNSNAVIRWRHDGRINALFVDGHVDNFGMGQLKQRHIQCSY